MSGKGPNQEGQVLVVPILTTTVSPDPNRHARFCAEDTQHFSVVKIGDFHVSYKFRRAHELKFRVGIRLSAILRVSLSGWRGDDGHSNRP
jgi:hypothetical protein